MAHTQLTLLLDAPANSMLATVLINPHCRRGQTVNHSCRQCLKRTLEAWGYDADAYDADALRETGKQRAKNHRQRWYVKGDIEKSHKNRQRKYGISAQEYQAMFTAQGGLCALCRHPETRICKGTLVTLAVDHDHQTGAVRGLLCTSCNNALGYLEKLGMAWMVRAEDYLHTTGTLGQSFFAVLALLKEATFDLKKATFEMLSEARRGTTAQAIAFPSLYDSEDLWHERLKVWLAPSRVIGNERKNN